MDADITQLLHLRAARPAGSSADDLVACSLCLRVRRGSDWLPAEQVIREIRSYDLATLPRLNDGVCEFCAEGIFDRRTIAGEAIAA